MSKIIRILVALVAGSALVAAGWLAGGMHSAKGAHTAVQHAPRVVQVEPDVWSISGPRVSLDMSKLARGCWVEIDPENPDAATGTPMNLVSSIACANDGTQHYVNRNGVLTAAR